MLTNCLYCRTLTKESLTHAGGFFDFFLWYRCYSSRTFLYCLLSFSGRRLWRNSVCISKWSLCDGGMGKRSRVWRKSEFNSQIPQIHCEHFIQFNQIRFYTFSSIFQIRMLADPQAKFARSIDMVLDCEKLLGNKRSKRSVVDYSE